MVIKTKENSSLLTGFVAALCVAIAAVICGAVWWVTVTVAAVTFVVVAFFSLMMMYNYVAYKLKPIYSVVFSRNVHTGEIFDTLKTKRVEDISAELNAWAAENDEVIARLQDTEKFRKQYLGNVAHELKTPIFNIQGYVSTLLDGALDDEQINRQYLERASKSIDRMINIIKDLDTISKLESDMSEMAPERFDVVALAKEVADECQMEAAGRNVTIDVRGAADLPSRFMAVADRHYIGQVLENLIINSIHYGKENGTTTIHFRDMLDKVLVEVEDDGQGIGQKDLQRIFERFYRTDKGRSREQGGTGLGLAIVKHIIEAHGEHISVRSELGAGSTFAFTLKKAKKQESK